MAGFKRRRRSTGRRLKKRARSSFRPSVQRIVNRALNKNLETKESVTIASIADGSQILHNDMLVLDNQVLYTTQGVTDPMVANVNNRIGDRINLKGVQMKLMLELNERYSDVTFRLLVVKASRGDTPTIANLFVGQSQNKIMDKFNKERYTILYQKYIKMRAPNQSTVGALVNNDIGVNSVGGSSTLSRATRFVKVWIPGRKFTKSGVIVYDNGGSNPKFFDYHVLLLAYSNFSTYIGSDPLKVYFVGRVNEFIKTMYYKDG